MKKNKHSLKISRSCFGDTTLDGYPIATYNNDELKILKNLLMKVSVMKNLARVQVMISFATQSLITSIGIILLLMAKR